MWYKAAGMGYPVKNKLLPNSVLSTINISSFKQYIDYQENYHGNACT